MASGSNRKQDRGSVGLRAADFLIRTADSFLDLCIISFFLGLFVFATYTIWDNQQIYGNADATVYESYKPEAEADDSPTFAELQEINPDVLGWMTIYGTGIDYPLVQGRTNDDYINTTVDKKFALSGSIFLESQNARDFSDFNTIIYGHHMEQSEMFGDLDKFRDQAFFDTHKYGNLYYGGKNRGLLIFCVMDADAYDSTLYNYSLSTPEDEAAYLNYISGISSYIRNADGVSGASNVSESGVNPGDHILMLSTCATDATNGRYVVFAKVMGETYANPFPKEEKPVVKRLVQGINLPFMDTLPSWWLYGAFLFVALVLFLLVYGIIRTVQARRAGKREKSDLPEAGDSR